MRALRLLWAWLWRPSVSPYRNAMAGRLRLFPAPAPFAGTFGMLQREVAKGMLTEDQAAMFVGSALAVSPLVKLARIPADAVRAAKDEERKCQKFAVVFEGGDVRRPVRLPVWRG